MSGSLIVVRALSRRALNEVLRVPGAAIPGILAPTIFLIGLSGVFEAVEDVRGFTADSFRAYLVPVSILQAAGFSGAATGVNLGRDIEQGWFDRLLVGPASRTTLLAGLVSSAALRALLPVTFLMAVALLIGVPFPGIGGLLVAYALALGMACAVACYAIALALKFKTQQAAPLMQAGAFAAILFTTSYAPKELLADWLRVVATANPVTLVLDGVRQGFVGDVALDTTLQGVAAIAGLLLVLGFWARRSMLRYGD